MLLISLLNHYPVSLISAEPPKNSSLFPSVYSSDLFCLLLTDLETTSPAWRVLAQTSPWFAHGKPLATWSSATWQNMELSSPLSSAFTSIATIVPRVFLPLIEQLTIYYMCAIERGQTLMHSFLTNALYMPLPCHQFSIVPFYFSSPRLLFFP